MIVVAFPALIAMMLNEPGRGMGHGGTLNFGDAFSYALATSLNASLRFAGKDFAAIDIKPALASL
jgi:ribonuclease VapC